MLMYDRTYPCEPVSECRRYVFTAFGRMIDICPPTTDSLCQHIHGTMLQSGIWSCFTNLTGSIVSMGLAHCRHYHRPPKGLHYQRPSRLKIYVHVKCMLFGAQTFFVVKDIVRSDQLNPTHRCFLFADANINLKLCLPWLLKERCI